LKRVQGELPKLKTWQYIWYLIRFRPWLYVALGILETLFFGVFPQVVGWITYTFFNVLTGDAPIEISMWALIALLMATAIARAAAIFGDVAVYFTFQYSVAALLRKNLFEHILRRPGARAVPGSPGEAISRFRGDVDEISHFMAESLILLGFGLFALISVVVMLRINARITLIVFLPLVIVVVAANLATRNVEKYRQANRRAAGSVTDFIGEIFGSAQAVKVATAEPHVIRRFGELNEARRRAALRDRLFNELLDSVFRNVVHLGTGAILLLAGKEMQAGAFTVGDFALFVYYLGFVIDFTGLIGVRWAWYKQVGVSFGRLVKLLADAPPENLVEHSLVYMRGPLPPVEYTLKTEAHRLETLEAIGLTYLFPGSQRGIRDVSLRLERGSFTVITGRIGSGKTTLLRTLLGLLPKDAGDIYWNAQRIQDPASFFVPPHSAYTAQAPLLFSETLQDNILMGLPEEEVDILVQAPRTGNEQSLRVIGVLEQSAFYAGGGIITSQATLDILLDEPVPPLTYMFRLKEGLDAKATAKALEARFLEHGMQAEVMADEIREGARIGMMMNNLLQGFMGLGLVVGIAALGVIAARSMVERRQQIGVLRALGFQKSMVQLSFLLESSFVALLGIAIGIALGAALSVQIINTMSENFEGITYQVPWLNILVVAIIAYGASLLTTYLPARQAANVYPAEALRYE